MERGSVGTAWEGEEGEFSPGSGMGSVELCPAENKHCRAADVGDAVLGVSYRHMTDGKNI